jgi:lysophospholipase L1-like esterase
MWQPRRLLIVFSCVVVACIAGGARTASAAPLKVACTGTSAMAGLGSTDGHHVPDELGRALGPGFVVQNFAVEGATAISAIPSSYAATPQMQAALAWNPDIVLFWFGGNDSFQATWDAYKGEFQADYTNLVRTFQALPSHPKTFLVRLWVFVNTPAQQTVIAQQILPMIDQMAVDTGSTLIDYQKAFENHPEYFPDGMHPDDAGTLAIGQFFADSITAALGASVADSGTDGAPADAAAGDADETDAPALPTDAAADVNRVVPPVAGPEDSGGAAASARDASSASGGTAASSSGSAASGGAPATSDAGGCQFAGSTTSGRGFWLFVACVGLLTARRRKRS